MGKDETVLFSSKCLTISVYLHFPLKIFNQMTISRSSSAVVVVLDPVASSGVITDMTAVFAAEKSALASVGEEAGVGEESGAESPTKIKTAYRRRDEAGVDHSTLDDALNLDEDEERSSSASLDDTPPASQPEMDHHKSAISLEPNLKSLVFHCVSPARLVLVWWPKRDRSTSSPLLLQIMREAAFDDGVVARMPAPDEYCVVVGKLDFSQSVATYYSRYQEGNFLSV